VYTYEGGNEKPDCGALLDFKIFNFYRRLLANFNEFKVVLNSLNFAQGIERLPTQTNNII